MTTSHADPLPRIGQMPPRVLIAGGGVAALEGLLALRELAEDRVTIDVLAPDDFTYRPLEIATLFGHHRAPRYDLGRIVADQGAGLHEGELARVDMDRRLAVTARGEELSYDALLVAVGARMRYAVPGAVPVLGPQAVAAMATLLSDVESGCVRRIALVAPGGSGWLLPLYELALMLADELRARAAGAELAIVTPEEAPLEVFGPAVSEEVAALLGSRGIELLLEHLPTRAAEGGVATVLSGWVAADRVLALPALAGRSIPGLPTGPGGFIPTDAHGLVDGASTVYAAGDGTAFPVKQGGLAAQQAAAAAAHIAWRAGAPVTPQAFRPVLRGLLLTGGAPRYLRADLSDRNGGDSAAAHRALWWPPAKIAGRRLAPYLAARPQLELSQTVRSS